MSTRPLLIFAVGLLLIGTSSPLLAQQNPMSFFVTSVGLGNGGNLGGLSGADRHCQSLATAVGAGSKTWHAYLSTQGAGGVNAKDRIGGGPWFNAKGVQVAANVAELHGDKNNIGCSGQWARRYTQPTRHAHRDTARWYRCARIRRRDLR
jgi:hypothetical protein